MYLVCLMLRTAGLYLVLLSWCCLSLGSTSHLIYDETVWAKQIWPKYKLEFALRKLNPSEDVQLPPEITELITSTYTNSLDGPFPRRVAKSRTSADIWEDHVAETLEEEELVEFGAQAIQCLTCHALLEYTWDHLVAAMRAGSTPDGASISETLRNVCRDHVPRDMVKRYSILKLYGGTGQSGVMLFVVRDRREDAAAPTGAEVMAVKKACENLVRDHELAFVQELIQHLKQLRDQEVRIRLLFGLQKGYMEDEEEDEYLDEEEGEEDNQGLVPTDNTDFEAKVQEVVDQLRSSVTNRACGASKACISGVAGSAFEAQSVFVDTRPPWVGHVYHGVAQISEFPQGALSHAARLPAPWTPPTEQPAEVAVATELQGKVLIAANLQPQSPHHYEFVYQRYISQYIPEEPRPTLQYALGYFQKQEMKGPNGIPVLETPDLLPGIEGFRWPYMSQKYVAGDPCGQFSTQQRSCEVRLACSPDSDVHLLVREPEVCKYVVVIYVTSLCQFPEYTPQPQ